MHRPSVGEPRHRQSANDHGRRPNPADAPLAAKIGFTRPSHERDGSARSRTRQPRGDTSVRKALPEKMFVDPEQSRLTMLRSWVLDNEVTVIQMKERQFWNFAALQPVAEKPWATFMGRAINVPDMPVDAQKHLGIFDRNSAGVI
jgi:hypothetical protein